MRPPVPDSFKEPIGEATEAFASILEHHARMLRHNVSREDTAITLLPIVQLATGRT